MLENLYRAYAATAVSEAIRKSTWAFAVIEMVHLVALAVLGGALIVTALALTTRRFAFAGATQTWRGARWIALAALAATIVSGALMVGSNPLKYYFNAAFTVKLWLLLAGIAVALVLDRLSRPSDLRQRASGVVAVAVALLWLAVALAGRAIGLL